MEEEYHLDPAIGCTEYYVRRKGDPDQKTPAYEGGGWGPISLVVAMVAAFWTVLCR
jgi:hypothetical protein